MSFIFASFLPSVFTFKTSFTSLIELLFPNSLYHQVYPFIGSGERRSIAFNMAYKVFSKTSGVQMAGDSINLYNETHHADTIPWKNIENGYHK